MKHGVYVHIPFCRRKCDYCSFYSIPASPEEAIRGGGVVDAYIDRLIGEIRQRDDVNGLEADSVYFGGGTPSMLRPDGIERIIEALAKTFRFDADTEISIEFNPEDFSGKKIHDLAGSGVNRVTMGVQTLDEETRAALGRSSPAPDTEMLEEFRSIGSITHGVDIIAGVPSRATGSFLHELEKLTRLRFEHISAYLLAVEQGTPLFDRFEQSARFEEAQISDYRALVDFLKHEGYEHYEVSNFALKGFRSRHNMKYWSFEPYVGYGVRAHSFYSGRRWFNGQTVQEYLQSGRPVLTEDVRSRGGEIVEFVLTGLRLTEGISMKRYREVFSRGMPDDLVQSLRSLEKRALARIVEDGGDTRFALTVDGMLIMDALLAELPLPPA